MGVTSIQDYVRDIVLSKRLCSSMGASGEWFPFAFLSGDNIIVYIACQKKSKSLDFHVRWSTIEKNPGTSAAIAWGDSNRIDLQMPIGQSISKRTKRYVTRYNGNVKLDVFQDLLLSNRVSFVSGEFSEELVMYNKTNYIVIYLAHCVGFERLSEALRDHLNQEFGSFRRKEEKKTTEVLRKAKQKRALRVRKCAERILRSLIENKRYVVNISTLRSEFKQILKNDREWKLFSTNSELADIYLKENGFMDPEGNLDKSFNKSDLHFIDVFGVIVPFREVEQFMVEKHLIEKYKSSNANNSEYCLSEVFKSSRGVEAVHRIVNGQSTIENEESLLSSTAEKYSDDAAIQSKAAVSNIAKDESSSQDSNKPSGCYIATCVYGSYDCPEVWTLRRFRDYSLSKTLLGRLVIKIYYAISPKLVRRFGSTNWFRFFWRKRLDSFVKKLKVSGYESTQYEDM